MPAEFIEIKGPGGKSALLNLSVVFAITEEANGNAIAITLTGTKLDLGEKFAELRADLVEVPDDDAAGS